MMVDHCAGSSKGVPSLHARVCPRLLSIARSAPPTTAASSTAPTAAGSIAAAFFSSLRSCHARAATRSGVAWGRKPGSTCGQNHSTRRWPEAARSKARMSGSMGSIANTACALAALGLLIRMAERLSARTRSANAVAIGFAPRSSRSAGNSMWRINNLPGRPSPGRLAMRSASASVSAADCTSCMRAARRLTRPT